MPLYTYQGRSPRVHPTAFVAPTAVLIGDVIVGEGASVWFGTVLRADMARIEIGARSNVQDNSTIHTDPGEPTIIGEDVTIGHNAHVHSSVVERNVLIGQAAVLVGGCVVGTGTIVGAGAVVPQVEKMQKDEEGRKKINQWTRYATGALAAVQAWGFALFTESLTGAIAHPGMAFRFQMAFFLTTGAIFVMWLGEQITERGLGNGASLIIFFSIVERIWPGCAAHAAGGGSSPGYRHVWPANGLQTICGAVHIARGDVSRQRIAGPGFFFGPLPGCGARIRRCCLELEVLAVPPAE